MVILRLLSNRAVTKRFILIKSRMLSIQTKTTYEGAIDMLNSLQTNSQYLKNAVANPTPEANKGKMVNYLNRTGITLEKLDSLSVIHITGTKGKGTTCAYCENILRDHGLKTGFFSSPHLLDVRERIRINGKAISKHEFALQFWRIYEQLDKQKAHSADMPMYFSMLTILAFHVFLENKVDIAILEVGIGGEYDCTNVVRKPAVVAVTPLDLDHTSLLGHSIESIAWNKGGIIKEGALVFTTEQPKDAMKVLLERSSEKKCNLKVVENVHSFENANKVPKKVQRTNANLALAIVEAYITRETANNNNPRKSFSLALAKESIEKTYWPGRYEIKSLDKLRFFLDGAHTLNSIQVCVDWFKEASNTEKKKALIFNLTGNRKADIFFTELCKIPFDVVIFIPNVGSDADTAANKDLITTSEEQLERCKNFRNDWLKLEEKSGRKTDVVVFPCFSQAVNYLHQNEFDVLVTGSIHLVGAALSVLDPTLNGTLVD